MGFNGFICDECGCLVDFAAGDEAGTCASCDQFDLGDGNAYCLRCCQQKEWAHCDKCGDYLCTTCHQENHTCPNCADEADEADKADKADVFEEVEHITLPAGEYYIGDPYYIVSDDVWDQWCTTHEMKNGCVITDGAKWVIDSTHCGDGAFTGSDGHVYCVDAGSLGMVPAYLFDPTKMKSANKLGTFYTFDTEISYGVSCSNKSTIFTISDSDSFILRIKTW
jgi:hypothetical protein